MVQDCPLLGVQWEGKVYVDVALPFWPLICTKKIYIYIFTALADGLEWIAKEHGVERCITRGTENSDECKLNLQRHLCNHLGVYTNTIEEGGGAVQFSGHTH